MFDGDKLIAFVDGFVTDEEDLTDEMYAKAQLHNESGAWQMIFGVNTIPAYRKHGYAGELIKCAIEDARKQERKWISSLLVRNHLDALLCRISDLRMREYLSLSMEE